ncbi:MAG: hydrolase 2, exosortase A system-associated [Herbaspirillum sp.]|nr:hydrolase 2, exosortase A system-associated [Herbaspirillum sp.]
MPFFLPAAQGARLCLYHAPAAGQPCRGGMVLVAPFAEEMNRSRRMAALQAAAMARAGIGVLIIDLYGCGDSAGELADAQWSLWHDDIGLALDWLRERLQAPVGLLGVRLGALLALDVARTRTDDVSALLFCNPVLDGQAYMTQFLRLRLAAGLLSPQESEGPSSVQEMRVMLQEGELLEVAGYELSGALLAAIDGLHARVHLPVGVAVHWMEVVRDASAPLSPAIDKVARAWSLTPHVVEGPAFWSTPEVSTCPALIELATSLALSSLGA